MTFNFKSITDKLQGRSTAFLLAFFGIGHVMAFTHRLDATYIAFFTAFMGFVVGKSHLDNKNDQAMAALNGKGEPDGGTPK